MRLKAAKELLHTATRNLESLAMREELDEMQAQLDAMGDDESSGP